VDPQAQPHVHLVESNQRKAAFLRAVIRETGCPATVHAGRIEAVTDDLLANPGPGGPVQAVSARALADLGQLLAYAAPFSAAGACCIFHKGRNFREEVAQASHDWAFDLVEKNSLMDPDSRLLVIDRIRPRRVAGKG
jgi:16S rRNA (guanine527-N7)-methyltransferase